MTMVQAQSIMKAAPRITVIDPRPVTPQGTEQQLQQVQGLGIGHNAHSQQYSVCGEKAAYGGKGEVTVPVNIFTSYHVKSTLHIVIMTRTT